ASVLVFYPNVLHQIIDGRHWALKWPIAAVLFVLVSTLSVPTLRQRLARFAKNMLASVRKFRARNLVMAICIAACITFVSTVILLATALSLGVRLYILQFFLFFSLGMLVSTATPTPGGLVGAEAGLFAGFVAYGVSAPTAGAVVLLYRLVTYWLPLL